MKPSLLLAACLVSVPALAFEGVIDMKITAATGMNRKDPGAPGGASGTTTLTIKGLDSRVDMSMNVPGMSTPMIQHMIHKASEPNVTYIFHDGDRTYSRFDSKEVERMPSEDTKDWTMKRLGKDTVAGRTTEHVLVTQGSGKQIELWIDRNLVSAADLEKAFSAGGSTARGEGWWAMMRKEGVEGMPLKMLHRSKDGTEEMSMEATRVQSKSVSSSLFEIPAGYTERKGFPAAGGLTPQQRQEMMKSMMDKLTPEQRQKMEQMMKQRGGAGE